MSYESYFGSQAYMDAAALELIRRAGGDELVARRIEIFRNRAVKVLGSARGALGTGDGPGVERALHALRASAAELGAHSVVSLCAAGERLARGRRLEDCAPMIERIASENESVLQAMQSLVGE